MREIRSGREQKKIMSVNTQKKNAKESERKSRAADGAAIVCAVLCAASLCIFGGRDASSKDAAYQTVGSGALGAVTYTPPKQSDEWSFWDYFADVMAGVFGFNG